VFSKSGCNYRRRSEVGSSMGTRALCLCVAARALQLALARVVESWPVTWDDPLPIRWWRIAVDQELRTWAALVCLLGTVRRPARPTAELEPARPRGPRSGLHRAGSPPETSAVRDLTPARHEDRAGSGKCL